MKNKFNKIIFGIIMLFLMGLNVSASNVNCKIINKNIFAYEKSKIIIDDYYKNILSKNLKIKTRILKNISNLIEKYSNFKLNNKQFTVIGYLKCKNEKLSNNLIIQEFMDELKKEKEIKFTQKINSFNKIKLPKGIYKEQLTEYPAFFEIGNFYISYVYRNNRNFGVTNMYSMEEKYGNRDTNFSGILISKKSEKKWIKFVGIKNFRTIGNNNPLFLKLIKKKLYFSTVAANGAGSGEGDMIKFVSEDFGKNWEIDSCYYYTGHYDCKFGKHSDPEYEECKEYAYLKNNNKFYNIVKKEVIENKNCLDVKLETYY